MRDYITRKEYDAWINESAALAIACGYPVQDSMLNDSAGLVLGDDQYEAFVNGIWSREPYEVFAIFESMNEPAIDGLPEASMEYADFGGLCDKIMIVHPGKFCSAHFHWRKTEYYEVVLGEMDLFYAPEIIDFPDLGIVAAEVIQRTPMPQGDPWPDDIVLATGREEAWKQLTSYQRLRKGDPNGPRTCAEDGLLKPARYVPEWASGLRRLSAYLAYSLVSGRIRLESVELPRFLELDETSMA